MQDNISPEERLLRLIRRSPKKPAGNKEEPAAEAANKPAIERFNRQAPGVERATAKISFPISFELLNRVILAAILILGIYLLLDFLTASPKKIEEKILELEVKEIEDKDLEIADKAAKDKRLKPVSHYSEPVKSRNLFTAASRTAQARPTATFMEMTSKLRLQGIISGINPQAVIEDSKTRQVYFLSPGERIGEIELKEILPGKVILSYYGQEAELTL